jgi:DNA-binding transcriptional MerR regulator
LKTVKKGGVFIYSISKLCKEYKLSRSSLLYYDSIGLLKASSRTNSNYRMYSEEDKTRLGQICLFREAGISLEQIKVLLDSNKDGEENVLLKRLVELNNELHILRLQQKIILEILKDKKINKTPLMMDKKTFVSVLKSSGVKEAALNNLHIEFERKSPEEHKIFLEFLGISENEINCIIAKAKSEIELSKY